LIISLTFEYENKGILKFFAGLAIGIGIGIAFGAAFSQGKIV